jgi:ATP-binding cassette subfamily B protein
MKILSNSMTKLSTYLRSIFARYKIYFGSLCAIAITASVSKTIKSYNIKEIIDSVQLDTNFTTLLMLFVFYTLMHHGMFFISRLLDMRYKPIILAETITSMYKKTLGHSLHWFDSHLSGEVSSKITDFQDNLTTFMTYCFQALNNITTVVISILFLLSINVTSAAIILIFVIIYTPIIALLLKRQMALYGEYVAARQETLGIINDSIANIFGIKIIGNV